MESITPIKMQEPISRDIPLSWIDVENGQEKLFAMKDNDDEIKIEKTRIACKSDTYK